MRVVLAFVLSLVFSLNAAYASVASVCDAMDHLSLGERDLHLHADHHSHDADAQSHGDGDPLKNAKSGDHCHAHGTWVSMVSNVDVTPVFGDHVLSPSESAPLLSVTTPRLERPPRAFLA